LNMLVIVTPTPAHLEQFRRIIESPMADKALPADVVDFYRGLEPADRTKLIEHFGRQTQVRVMPLTVELSRTDAWRIRDMVLDGTTRLSDLRAVLHGAGLVPKTNGDGSAYALGRTIGTIAVPIAIGIYLVWRRLQRT